MKFGGFQFPNIQWEAILSTIRQIRIDATAWLPQSPSGLWVFPENGGLLDLSRVESNAKLLNPRRNIQNPET
jgi:hypothetical protein